MKVMNNGIIIDGLTKMNKIDKQVFSDITYTQNRPFGETRTLQGWLLYWLKYYTVNNFRFVNGTYFPFPSIFWSLRKKYRYEKNSTK